MLPVWHRNNLSEWFHYWPLTVWSVLIRVSSHCNDCLEGSLWLNKSVVLTHAGRKMNTNHSFLGCIVKRVWLAAYQITAKPLLTDSCWTSAPVAAQTHILIGSLNNQSVLNSKQAIEQMNILFQVFWPSKETQQRINVHTYFIWWEANKQTKQMCLQKSHTFTHWFIYWLINCYSFAYIPVHVCM